MPNKLPKIFFPILWVFWAFPGAGASGGGVPVDSGNISRLVLEQNREIRAARQLIAEAQARTRSSGRLSNPEIEAEVAGGQDFEGRVSVGLTQRFPITSRLRHERELSGLAVKAAQLEVEQKEWEIVTAARMAFYELTASREAVELGRRQVKSSSELARLIEESAASGIASTQEARETSLTVRRLEADMRDLEIAEIEADARLCGLLGLPVGTALVIRQVSALPSSLPETRKPGRRPDIELAELAITAGIADVSLARASRWDDVAVGIFMEGERFRDEPDGIEPELLTGVRVSVPLPFWQNGSGRISEKEAAAERRRSDLEALRFGAANEAATAHQVMAVRYRAAREFDSVLIPAAQKNLAEAGEAGRKAEAGVEAVIRARDALSDLEMAAIEARKNYFLAYAAWLAAVGDHPTPP